MTFDHIYICNIRTYLSIFPLTGWHTCNIYIQTTAPAEYLADAAEVVLVPQDDQWKEKANARIDSLRKANISIK